MGFFLLTNYQLILELQLDHVSIFSIKMEHYNILKSVLYIQGITIDWMPIHLSLVYQILQQDHYIVSLQAIIKGSSNTLIVMSSILLQVSMLLRIYLDHRLLDNGTDFTSLYLTQDMPFMVYQVSNFLKQLHQLAPTLILIQNFTISTATPSLLPTPAHKTLSSQLTFLQSIISFYVNLRLETNSLT